MRGSDTIQSTKGTGSANWSLSRQAPQQRKDYDDSMEQIPSLGLAELLISAACCILVLVVAMVILALVLVLYRRD